MNKLGWILGLGVVTLIIGSAIWLASGESKVTPIRLGTSPWPGYEFLHLADRKGFFKEMGVPVQLVRFNSLEDMRRAYERHQVDGFAATLIELLQAYEHGAPAKIIIITDFSNGADVILARKEIGNVASLKNRKVGVEPATLGAFIIARALNKVGLTLEDVKMEGLNSINMESALLAGTVDAVHVYPPISLTIAKHEDQVRKIFDSSEIPGEIVDIVSLTPEIVANRRKEVQGLRQAWDKAIAYAAANPEESNQIMAGYEGISPQEFAEALKGLKILSLAEQESLIHNGKLEQTIEHVAEVLQKEGELKESVSPAIFIMDRENRP